VGKRIRISEVPTDGLRIPSRITSKFVLLQKNDQSLKGAPLAKIDSGREGKGRSSNRLAPTSSSPLGRVPLRGIGEDWVLREPAGKTEGAAVGASKETDFVGNGNIGPKAGLGRGIQKMKSGSERKQKKGDRSSYAVGL